jgi:hypothetical protein
MSQLPAYIAVRILHEDKSLIAYVSRPLRKYLHRHSRLKAFSATTAHRRLVFARLIGLVAVYCRLSFFSERMYPHATWTREVLSGALTLTPSPNVSIRWASVVDPHIPGQLAPRKNSSAHIIFQVTFLPKLILFELLSMRARPSTSRRDGGTTSVKLTAPLL